MADPSRRGKVAEGLLAKQLGKMSTASDTAFYRMPDAMAGSFKVSLADFLLFRRGTAFLIECKETVHDYRLPHANFSADQVARMRMYQMAGAVSLVLTYHSTLKLWRGYNVVRFVDRVGGSWDLRDTNPRTLAEVLEGPENVVIPVHHGISN